MPTKSIIATQAYIEKKIQWVLQTYLGGLVAQQNLDLDLTGDDAISPPKQYFIGADVVPLAQIANGPFDQLPALVVKEISSVALDSTIAGDRDVETVYEILAVYVSDGITVDWTTKQARQLALCAEQVLEAYLPDTSGLESECVVWDTQLVSTGSTSIIPMQNADTFWVAVGCTILVKSRANFQWDPKRLPSDMPYKSWWNYTFQAPSAELSSDLGVLWGTSEPGLGETFSVHQADVEDATSTSVTASEFPDGSPIYIINQTQRETYNTTITSGTATIPITSASITNGDQWTLTAINAESNTPCAYLVNWNVAPNTWSSDLPGQAGIAAARAQAGVNLRRGDIIIVDASGTPEEFFVVEADDDSLHVVPSVVPGGLSTSNITKRRGFRSEVPPTAGSTTFVDWTSTEQGTGTVTLVGSEVVLTSIDTGNNRAYIQCDGNQTKGTTPMLIIEGLTAIGDDPDSFGEAIITLNALGTPYEALRCIDDAWVIGSVGGDVPAGGNPLVATDLELILDSAGGVSWYRWGREGAWASHTIDQNFNFTYGAGVTVSRLDGTTAEATLTSAILLNL